MSKLLEEISRIKTLISENQMSHSFRYEGSPQEGWGLKIILTHDGNDIGEIYLLNYDEAKKYDHDIRDFELNSDSYCKVNCNRNHFNNENTLHSHSTEIKEPYRRNGYGTKLKSELENVARNLGYKYITSIVNCDNIPSQKLNKKLNYEIHQSNRIKDFLFKKLN